MGQPTLKLVAWDPDKHGKLVASWWEDRALSAWPTHMLPEYGGFIVYDSNRPVVAVWIYLTNSPVTFIGPAIADKDTDSGIRKEALRVAIEACKKQAKANGSTAVVGFSGHTGLIDSLLAAGFTKACDGQETYCILKERV